MNVELDKRKAEIRDAAETLIDLIYRQARQDHEMAAEEDIISGVVPAPTLPEGFHLGYSRISKYQECPRQYYYSYVEKIPYKASTAIRRGQAYHGVVEELLKFKMEHEGKLLDPMKADKLAVKMGKKEELTDSEIYRVIDAVRFYYSELYPKHRPIAVEEPFEMVRGGVPFTGRIDLIDAEGWVIDHKFSYDTWSEQRSRFGCQPIVYQWAALDAYEKKFPDWKFKGFQYNIIRLYPSPKIQRITVPYMGQDKSDWWENEVAIIAKGILTEHFPSTPGEKKCQWCSYKKLCNPVIYDIEVDTLAGKSDVNDEDDY